MSIPASVIKEVSHYQRRFLLIFFGLSIIVVPLIYIYFPYFPWASNRDIALGAFTALIVVFIADRYIPERYALQVEEFEILISQFIVFVVVTQSGYIKSPLNLFYVIGIIFSFFIVGRKFGYMIFAFLLASLAAETVMPVSGELMQGNWAAIRPELPFFFSYLVEMTYITIVLIFLSEVLRRIEERRVRAQDTAEHLQSQVNILEEVDREKSQFITLIAHHFRTPLSRIKWTFDGLKSGEFGKLTKEQQQIIEENSQANDNLIELLSQILTASEWEMQKVRHAVPVDVAKLLKSTVNHAIEEAKQHEVTVSFDSSSTNSTIEANEKGLAQVFQTIIQNAIVYNKKGGHVTITLKSLQHGVEVTVQDTGIGIPEDEQKLLFTAFFRAENVKTSAASYRGMGLFITKKIVEAHRGILELHSTEDKGTTVTIVLPYKQASKPQHNTTEI